MNRFGPLDPNKIEEMARKLADNLPEGLSQQLPQGFNNVREEMEQGFKATLSKGLDKLDLVTREEFDVQAAVLQRTRAKLEALETRLNELEEQA